MHPNRSTHSLLNWTVYRDGAVYPDSLSDLALIACGFEPLMGLGGAAQRASVDSLTALTGGSTAVGKLTCYYPFPTARPTAQALGLNPPHFSTWGIDKK